MLYIQLTLHFLLDVYNRLMYLVSAQTNPPAAPILKDLPDTHVEAGIK